MIRTTGTARDGVLSAAPRAHLLFGSLSWSIFLSRNGTDGEWGDMCWGGELGGGGVSSCFFYERNGSGEGGEEGGRGGACATRVCINTVLLGQ